MSTVKSSTYLGFSIKKILRAFFLLPLVFISCILSSTSFNCPKILPTFIGIGIFCGALEKSLLRGYKNVSCKAIKPA
jgi:hypothetical protein